MQIHRQLPLPNLKAINAHVRLAGIRLNEERREWEAKLKAKIEVIKKLPDHELDTFIDLTRMRLNAMHDGTPPFNIDSYRQYEFALEERVNRRNRDCKNEI